MTSTTEVNNNLNQGVLYIGIELSAKKWLLSFRILRIPSEAEEDMRRMHRELQRLTKEGTAHRVHMRMLLKLRVLPVSLCKAIKV